MRDAIQRVLPEMIKIRQHLHAHPELKYEEHQTAALVAEKLTAWGYTVNTGVGKTGVTAVLDSGKPGKTVGLRADMDALPMTEQTDLPYQSQIPGKMHACGHDGHTATLLTVAKVLRDFTDQFTGKVKFIFQPAEEGGAGAAAMIQDGVLKNPDVDVIYGYHNFPSKPVGDISSRSGCIFAGQNTLLITVNGKGGHAAMPHLTVDPIFIATAMVQALQGVVSRFTSPTEPCVLSVTQFHAGTTINVIPDQAEFAISLRTTSVEHQQLALTMLKDIIRHIAGAYGASADIVQDSEYPPTLNHAKESDRVLEVANELYGDQLSQGLAAPIMASEDFSYFLQQVPGCFFLVGNGEDSPMCHNTHYNFDDRVLPIAAEMLAALVLDR